MIAIGHKNEKNELDIYEFQVMGGIGTTAKDMLKFLGAQLGVQPTSLSDALKETHKIRFKGDNHVMGLG